MKKIFTLFTIMVALTLNSFGQIKGIDLNKAIPSKSPKFGNSEIPYEELLKQDVNYGGYIIYFKTTPVGLKHCIEEIERLISENNLNFDKPNAFNKELYASYVKGLKDYENLCTSIINGESEIKKGWDLPDGSTIALHLTQKNINIYIMN